jgi:hypothetical protein
MRFQLALPLVAALIAAPAVAAERIVLVIENRSSNAAAAAEIASAVSASLTRKGYEVVRGAEVEAAVRARTDATGLLERFQAKSEIEVTVRFLLSPQERERGPTAAPAAGIVARASKPGGVFWRNSLAVIDPPPNRPLANVASSKLLWSFPPAPGVALASADEEWAEMTGAPVATAAGPGDRDYDVLIYRQRASRTGPRFRLRIHRKDP